MSREPQDRYVGARMPRMEDARLLSGAGQFIDDIHLPRMLYACFLRSPVAHALITHIDVSSAVGLPGVFGVFTARDLTDLAQPMISEGNDVTGMGPQLVETSRPPLALDRVRFQGEAIAVVVAQTRYIAEDARELIDVGFEPLEANASLEVSARGQAPLVHEYLVDNSVVHMEVSTDSVHSVFSEAAHVFSKNFQHGRCYAAPLETRGVVSAWSGDGREVEIWVSHQIPHLLRSWLAPLLGIAESRVRVIVPDVGGGFGLKAHFFPEELVIPVVARRVGRPVKWIEDRNESLIASVHAREVNCEIEIAVDQKGRFLGFRTHLVGAAGAYSCLPYTPWVDVGMAGNALLGAYDVPNAAYTADAFLTNTCPTGAYRGVGLAVIQLARETLIDDIARALGIDPVKIRLDNCIPPEPRTTALGHEYDGGSYALALEKLRELVGYDDLRVRQAELRSEGRYLGIGFSLFVEPGAWGTRSVRAHGSDRTFTEGASVRVEPDGSVVVATGLAANGQGHATAFAQCAADALGVRPEDVRVIQGDTERTPFSMGTRASRAAVTGGGAIRLAANEVRQKLIQVAAEVLEASVEDIELEDGIAKVRGNPSPSVTVSEIAHIAYFQAARRPEAMTEPLLTATKAYDPGPTFSNGAVAVIVEVEAHTGIVKVESAAVVEDCGVMLNPMIVDGQILGGVAHGIGEALLEEITYDADGQILTGSLMDFLYPTALDVPDVRIEHLVTPSPSTEGGMKGMAEGSSAATPAAVANAVADALSPFGCEVNRTPISPDRVRQIIRSAYGSDEAAIHAFDMDTIARANIEDA